MSTAPSWRPFILDSTQDLQTQKDSLQKHLLLLEDNLSQVKREIDGFKEAPWFKEYENVKTKLSLSKESLLRLERVQNKTSQLKAQIQEDKANLRVLEQQDKSIAKLSAYKEYLQLKKNLLELDREKSELQTMLSDIKGKIIQDEDFNKSKKTTGQAKSVIHTVDASITFILDKAKHVAVFTAEILKTIPIVGSVVSGFNMLFSLGKTWADNRLSTSGKAARILAAVSVGVLGIMAMFAAPAIAVVLTAAAMVIGTVKDYVLPLRDARRDRKQLENQLKKDPHNSDLQSRLNVVKYNETSSKRKLQAAMLGIVGLALSFFPPTFLIGMALIAASATISLGLKFNVFSKLKIGLKSFWNKFANLWRSDPKIQQPIINPNPVHNLTSRQHSSTAQIIQKSHMNAPLPVSKKEMPIPAKIENRIIGSDLKKEDQKKVDNLTTPPIPGNHH